METVQGQIVAIEKEEIFSGRVWMDQGKIARIERDPSVTEKQFVLPGFIDAHVHIESSMLVPSEFARLAVVHGTVATVSDPHEIGNVLGIEGVDYMIENGSQVNFKFYFGAPSCVPATTFETAGSVISPEQIEELLSRKEILYLAEMMNWPGVLNGDSEVLEKIAIAKRFNKPVDGHAPGLKGSDALSYIQAGISTDHECFTKEEAQDKLKGGMQILIREGSAAKNFEALIDLLADYPDRMMFCSDDKHPDSLVEGHINQLAARAISKGIPLFNVLRAACLNPVRHYHLDVGTLKVGDDADFIIVEDLKKFSVLQTFIRGQCVAERGGAKIARVPTKIVNNWDCNPIDPSSLKVEATDASLQVIEVHDEQLVTTKFTTPVGKGEISSDIEKDILKLVVINRYRSASPAVAFIKNFGLKRGAIASSVAHDSHNLIAVGVDDLSIARALNKLIKEKGGIALADDELVETLPLPVAGLMSDQDGYQVAKKYSELDLYVKRMGSTLCAPFMTLSFMALLVIPSLKLSDRGLFDGDSFTFTPLFKPKEVTMNTALGI